MFRVLTGAMTLGELVAKGEPWLALADLDLLAAESGE